MLDALKKSGWFLILSMVILAMTLAGCSGGQATTPADTSSSAPTTTTEATTPVAAPTTTTEAPTTTIPPTTTTAAPALTATEIMNKAVAAWPKMTTYEYLMELGMNMTGLMDGSTKNIDMTFTGTGYANVPVSEMKFEGEMKIGTTGQGTMTVPMVMYTMNGWSYTKVNIPVAGEQWIKQKMDMLSFNSMDDFQQLMKLGESAVDVTLLGEGEIEGDNYFVIKINPNQAELAKWLENTQSLTGSTGTSDASAALDNLMLKAWISQDSFFMKKFEITLSMNAPKSTSTSTAPANDLMSVDLTETLTLTKYNQPVSIVLPPEAQNAQDMTSQQ